MKFKLSAALSAAIVLSVAIPAVAAALPGDEEAVSPKIVEEIAGLTGPVSRRPGPAKAPTTTNKRQFGGQSSRDALRLAAEHDPVLFGPQPTRALQLPPGATVKNYLDDFGARIDIAGQGPDVIASSTTPLRVTRDGVKRAVDLKLVDRGDVIEPLAPVVPLSFPKTLGRGITIGEHIRMRVVNADASAEAQLAGQQIFYANALTDADVFATPLPSGLETFVQLRSADSPTTIIYQLDLPAGARLVKQPGEPGGVGIIRGNDVLATVAAPVSTDANDALVPTTMRVDGDRLILDVGVTDSTVMPVLVDPVIDNQFAGGDSASTYGSFQNVSGWRRETSGAFGNFTFSPNSDSSYNGGVCYRVVGGQLVTIANQLCVSTQSSRSYGGEVGQWAWRPPTGIRGSASDGPNIPTDAYIYRAYVRHSYSRFSTSGGAYMYAGLRSGRTGGWIGASTDISQSGVSSDYRAGGWSSGAGYNGTIYNGSFLRHYCAATDCSIEHPTESVYDGTWFSFGLYALGSGHSASANAQGAVFYQYDRTPPTVTHTASSDLSGWKDGGSISTVVAGTDIGMGMQSVGVSYTNKDGQASGASRTYGCTGTTQSPCQPTYTQTFTTNVDNLPEGNATIGSTATDVLNKAAVTSPTVTVRVDRSRPALTSPSGPLWDARDRSDDHRYMGLYEAAYALHASSSDTYSGIKNIEVYVDGQSQASRGGLANGPVLDWTLQPDNYADGTHTVKIVTRDNVDGTPGAPDRHTDSTSFAITVDRRGDVDRAVISSGDPAAGGEIISSDMSQRTSSRARSENGPNTSSRDIVSCPSGTSSNEFCGEERVRMSDPTTGFGPDDEFSVIRGTSTTDARLSFVSELKAKPEPTDSPTAEGALDGALEAWQHPPPGHGNSFIRYDTNFSDKSDDGTAVNVSQSAWFDKETRLPLKRVTQTDGGITRRLYFDYASRLTLDEAGNAFSVPRPESPANDDETQYRETTPSDLSDAVTGAHFVPVTLGLVKSVAGAIWCSATRQTFTETGAGDAPIDATPGNPPSDESPQPFAPITAYDEVYRLVPSTGDCDALSLLRGLLPEPRNVPSLTISAYARASGEGQGWIDSYQDALDTAPSGADRTGSQLVQLLGQDVTAIHLPLSDDELAVMVPTTSTVYTIKGKLLPSDVPNLLQLLGPVTGGN